MSGYRENAVQSVVYRKLRVDDAERNRAIIRTLTLSNPGRKNAIGSEMVNELLHALDVAENDHAVRVLIITGDGSAFCAGGDFAQMTGGTDTDGTSVPHQGDYADLLRRLTSYTKPTIARVRGPAMGGGLGIVAACTFAIADETATFGTPEVRVGLFPMMIMAVLQRIVPRRKLATMMLLGDKITARDALEYGIIGRFVEGEAFDVVVDQTAHKICELSPSTLRLGLRAFAEQADLPLDEALPLLRDRLAEVLATDDAREGLTAFLEKRAPVWTGK